MAPLPVIPDTFRCAVRSLCSSQYAVNVFHVRSDTLSGGDVAAALATLIPNGDSPWTNLMSGQARTTDVTVTPLDGTSAALTENITGGDGALGGDAMVASGAVVSLQTGLRGPRHRGRIFIPFMGEGATATGFILDAARDPAQAALPDWQEELITAGMALVVASYVEPGIDLVTTMNVQRALGTQKRRQDRARGT